MAQSMNNQRLSLFESRIKNERTKLLTHPIYQELKSLESVRVFMKYHVFAVWDFMSLLKTLQNRLTSVTVPWTPPQNPHLSRFINEIVLAEECDEVGPNEYLSHFELYQLAMKEAGADLSPIQTFIAQIKNSSQIDVVLDSIQSNEVVRDFMTTTFNIITGKTHEVASSFLFGREDIIPEMFQVVLKEMNLLNTIHFKRMKQYLERHIEVDGDHHGPLARKMLIELCGDDPLKWEEAEKAAIHSIQARIGFWDHIFTKLSNQAVSLETHA